MLFVVLVFRLSYSSLFCLLLPFLLSFLLQSWTAHMLFGHLHSFFTRRLTLLRLVVYILIWPIRILVTSAQCMLWVQSRQYIIVDLISIAIPQYGLELNTGASVAAGVEAPPSAHKNQRTLLFSSAKKRTMSAVSVQL